MDLKTAYNLIAPHWNQMHDTDTWWVEGMDYFLGLLKPGSTVLDVGCGTGVKAKYMSDGGLHVFGIDISENMIALAQKTAPSGHFYVLDMREVGQLGEKYDAICAQAALLHIPKKQTLDVLQKLVAVLKPGGYCYISVKAIKPNGKEEDIVHSNEFGIDIERFFSYYTMDELRDYARVLGMEIVREFVTTSGRAEWLQVVYQKS